MMAVSLRSRKAGTSCPSPPTPPSRASSTRPSSSPAPPRGPRMEPPSFLAAVRKRGDRAWSGLVGDLEEGLELLTIRPLPATAHRALILHRPTFACPWDRVGPSAPQVHSIDDAWPSGALPGPRCRPGRCWRRWGRGRWWRRTCRRWAGRWCPAAPPSPSSPWPSELSNSL